LRARLLRTSSGSEGHCAEHHDEIATPHSDPFAASAALRTFFAELYYQPAGWRRRSQAAFRLSDGRQRPALTLGSDPEVRAHSTEMVSLLSEAD
jgi:hypothetical protein